MPTALNEQASVEDLEAAIPDFARKIAPVYSLLGWKWTPGASASVPNAAQIEETLRVLLHSAKKNDAGECRTGGLAVWIDDSEEERCAGMSMTIAHYIFW